MNTEGLDIKSCAHCGSQATALLIPATANTYLVGWECTVCREAVATICIHSMINYNMKKMGKQWNMRAELKEDNFTHYMGAIETEKKVLGRIEKCPYCGAIWKILWRKPYHRATHYCRVLEIDIVTGEYHDKQKLIDRLNSRE